VVELGLTDTISRETVRTTPKTGMTNRKIQYCVIPPEADSGFFACLEEILDTYEEPYNPAVPRA
jgi:hypothetical protein